MTTRRIPLARAYELPSGSTRKFSFEHDGRRTEAFVNRCVHLPITLDLDDNDFFTCDRNFFVCKTHGSVYEPRAGKCIGGPGQGKSLERLPLVIEGSVIYLQLSQ